MPSPTPEAVLPDPKPNIRSKSVWMNFLTVLAATPIGLKYLGGIDVPGTIEAISAVGTVLLPILSSYFRSTMTRAPVGSPLAKSIDQAKVAAEQQPQPPLDLMTAPIEDVVEQLPAFFERIQRIQATVNPLNQARLPSAKTPDAPPVDSSHS